MTRIRSLPNTSQALQQGGGREDEWRLVKAMASRALEAVQAWEQRWGPYPQSGIDLDEARLLSAWQTFAERMEGNHPFFHSRYVGQMLKPPHPAAITGYLAAMMVNPNNHALDGSPVTSEMEKEVVQDLAQMFRLPARALGHLCASGTIANLEALWVSRELHPGRALGFGEASHYTHERMCRLLRMPYVKIASTPEGVIDLDALAHALKTRELGTIVLTVGTTGRGRVDPVDEAVLLCQEHGVRVHVDAAYGGFFAVLADGIRRCSPRMLTAQ